MDILAGQTGRQFFGNGLANEARTSVKQNLDTWRGRRCRLVTSQPVGIATAGDVAVDIDDVLGRKGQTRQRAVGGAALCTIDAKMAVRHECANRIVHRLPSLFGRSYRARPPRPSAAQLARACFPA